MPRFLCYLRLIGVGAGLLLVPGCCAITGEEPADLELYQQRVRGTSYRLYAFRYPGHFVTSSDYEGWALLDAGTAFSRCRIEKLAAGRVLFLGQPARDHVNLLALNMQQAAPQDTLLRPVRCYTKAFQTIPVTIREYQQSYGQPLRLAGWQEYTFDRLHETADSVCFYGVVPRRGSLAGPARCCFAKGNIKVEAARQDTIRHIEIRQLVLGRDSAYKPSSPLQLVANQPVVGQATYWFYPRHSLKASALTDQGIFQRIR